MAQPEPIGIDDDIAPVGATARAQPHPNQKRELQRRYSGRCGSKLPEQFHVTRLSPSSLRADGWCGPRKRRRFLEPRTGGCCALRHGPRPEPAQVTHFVEDCQYVGRPGAPGEACASDQAGVWTGRCRPPGHASPDGGTNCTNRWSCLSGRLRAALAQMVRRLVRCPRYSRPLGVPEAPLGMGFGSFSR
jgi:hypothetical protein